MSDEIFRRLLQPFPRVNGTLPRPSTDAIKKALFDVGYGLLYIPLELTKEE